MTMVNVYWILFLVGLGFALISSILAGFGEAMGGGTDIGADHGGDLGVGGDAGVDLGHAGVDMMDHGGFHGHGEIGLNPVSPITIAAFLGGFGGGGVIGTSAGLSPAVSLSIAVPVGLLVGFGIYFIMYKINQGNVSSESRTSEVVGMTAEIITPIVEDSTGEIAYISRGSRYSSPARSIDKKTITRGSAVKIWRIVGSTCYVKEIMPEEAEDPGEDTLSRPKTFKG